MALPISESEKSPQKPGRPRLEWMEKSLPPHLTPRRPTTYTLELTAACNHSCIGCGNVFSRELGFMRGTTWIRLLNDLKSDIVSLRMTGGECTLHPDFKDIVYEIDQLDVPFVVLTNGNWHEPDRVLQLSSDCKNLDGVLVSLHGKDSHSHSAFVVTDSFSIVTRNIQRATDAGIKVGTNTILLKSNIEDIEQIAELSFRLGATSAAFSRYYGKPIPGLELSEAELHEAIARIATLRKQEPRIVFNNCVPMCFSHDIDMPTKGCTSGFTHCTIDPAGNVRPCTHSPVMLGSLFEQDIAEIWDSEPLWEWRNLISEACTTCGVFSQCRGGCRATAHHRGQIQDPLIRSPFDRLTAPRQALNLYQHACPIPNFTLRQDDFGFYIINRNRHICLSNKAMPILEMLDGNTTLEEIQTQIGQVAVDFVGTLALNGLVELV